MAVGMQSPIPNYSNFGSTIAASYTRSFNAANERALRLKVHQDELSEKQRQYDKTLAYNKGLALGKLDGISTIEGKRWQMAQDEYNYQKMERDQKNEIARHKNRNKEMMDRLDTDYQEAITEGDYAPGFWGRAGEIASFGLYDADWSKEQWMEEEGRSLPEYGRGLSTAGYTSGAIDEYRERKKWEDASDDTALMNLLIGLDDDTQYDKESLLNLLVQGGM